VGVDYKKGIIGFILIGSVWKQRVNIDGREENPTVLCRFQKKNDWVTLIGRGYK